LKIDGQPTGVLVDTDGSVYFTDNAGWLYRYSSGSLSMNKVSSNGLGGLAIHPVTKLVYAVEQAEQSRLTTTLYSITPDFTTDTQATPVATLPCPSSNLAFKASGEAFISTDCGIYKWKGSGPPVKWNTGSATPTAGEPATGAVFGFPRALAIDALGNMLISDYSPSWIDGCRVWLVEAATGLLRLVAGTGECCCNLIPDKPQASQIRPEGVAFGPGGRTAFIANSKRHRILKVMLECVGA
jgi:sugar lactone lactonase YvrE